MKIILLGAPGAGKGTQAAYITKALNIPAISTGDIIRNALKSCSELGKKAKSYMNEGKLVPDEIVIDIIKERLKEDDCKNGFILDGFPRTIAQAEALDSMGVEIDKVVDLEVDEDLIIRRLTGRRVCKDCGSSFHMSMNTPKNEGICDNCGGTLIQRKDDQLSTIMERLSVYKEQTEPLKGYYEQKGKLAIVYGTNDIEQTGKDMLAAMKD